VTIVSGRIVAI